MVDLIPKALYPNEKHAQIIKLTNRNPIHIDYGGILPYIYVRRTTPKEIDTRERFELTYKFKWDPYVKLGHFR